MAMLKKRSAEEAKTIPQIHDEEAASISAEPSTFGQFPFFREDRSAVCKQRAKRFPRHPRNRQDIVLGPEFTRTKFGEVVPQWYQQLFTIHAFSAGKLVPAICLRTNKDIGTYEFIFEALISRAAALEVDLIPDTIICDFETALIPAIQGYFPNARVQCCNSTSAKRYAEKQRRVMMHTGECISGRRTMEQFLEALMYLMPEPI
ncbi:hypothetical protein T01_11502 [Trichinella spiralis]|uniref:MULE transposase domain-containing protein n=1 Tax=Trichinella spiralis TaxID=6334 RepID=A0A0V1BVM0_TRISP|nr:hypothetical protein T01_11502 [Trichinella spiralis]